MVDHGHGLKIELHISYIHKLDTTPQINKDNVYCVFRESIVKQQERSKKDVNQI